MPSNSTTGVGVGKTDYDASVYNLMKGDASLKDTIIKTKFNNAGIKIVSNIQLTTQKIEEIKKEIGVEDEKEN